MLRSFVILALALIALTAVTGIALFTSQAPSPAGKPDAQTDTAPVYSPFVVTVAHEHLPFSEISFKDVGLSISEDSQGFVYEAIAEGLSMELGSAQTAVSHDPQVVQPHHHLTCEARHIYVDMWRTQAGLGYSLWSGCGEDGRFAHREISAPIEEPLTAAKALAIDIAGSLTHAAKTGCFTKHC